MSENIFPSPKHYSKCLQMIMNENINENKENAVISKWGSEGDNADK